MPCRLLSCWRSELGGSRCLIAIGFLEYRAGTARSTLRSGVQVDRGGDDGLGPIGSTGKIGRRSDFSAHHFEKQNGFWTVSFGRIGLGGIVIDAQMVDERKQSDEIFAAAVPAFADFHLGNVVTAVGHAAAHAAEMEVGAGQSAEPQMQAMT